MYNRCYPHQLNRGRVQVEEVAVERVENVSSFVREVIRIITHSHLDNANVFMVGHFLVVLILIDLLP